MPLLPNNPPDLSSQYVSPTGELSNRTLKLGEWYVAHKILLQKIGTWVLIAWCVVTIGFGIYAWGEYLLVGARQDDLLLRQGFQAPNYQAIHAGYQARDLSIGDVQVFRSAASVFTFAAGVTNPNSRHLARVQYRFGFSGGETPVLEAVVLPGMTRDIAVFGVSSSQVYPTDARLVVLKTEWRRVDPHRIPDPAAYMKERIAFTPNHFIFLPANTGDGLPVPSVSFDLTNDSAYSYWQPVFYVELLDGDRPVGLAPITVSQFRSGETRHIDLHLFGDTPSVSDIRVIPTMNVFDPSIFISPGQ